MNNVDLIPHLLVIAPEIFLAIAGLLLLLYGVFRGDSSTGFVTLLTAASFAFALWLISRQGNPCGAFGNMIVVNGFTHFAKMLVLVSATLVLAMTHSWLKVQSHGRFEYPILVLFAVVGMMLMISANDLLVVYVGLELASLSLYVLAAFKRDDLAATEAGLKYFTLGALASGMILFGASLIYGFGGSTNFSVLSQSVAAITTNVSGIPLVSPGLMVGIVMVLVGLCFKISAVPFHMWTPDVYQGAPTPVTAFFSTAPKFAALALLLRFLFDGFGTLSAQWMQVVYAASVASMLVGAFGALRQNNLKRLLAYSSIGHVGYVLAGIVVANEAGIKAVLVYLALYLFMSVGAFACLLMMKRKGSYVEDISELSGASVHSPRLALALAVLMFSMAGIPPLAGFFGKMYIFLSVVNAGYYVLAVIGVLTSVVAAFYYIRVVKVMYFDEAHPAFDTSPSLSLRAVLLLCALVTALFFLAPGPLVYMAAEAASALAM